LMITRSAIAKTVTALFRKSPTFYVQTLTATWFAERASQTSIVLTQSAPTTTKTSTRTVTAYPIPATPTRSATPYPLPKSAQVQVSNVIWSDLSSFYHR
jgi:hypothetical protein